MTGRNRIFISCVTSEFKEMREILRRYLARADCDVRIQEDFSQSEADTVQKLDQYIAGCSAVIHLVGSKVGAVAAEHAVREYLGVVGDFLETEPGLRTALGALSGLSYTQWESYLAVHHHIPLFVYRRQTGQPEASQQQHEDRLKSVGRHPEDFQTTEELLGKLIGDLRTIVALPEPTPSDMGNTMEGIKRNLIDSLSRFPDLFVRPSRFFAARFERGSSLPDALVFAAVMSLAGFAASIALRVGHTSLSLGAVATATLGNVTLWLMYAVFLQAFVFLFGARRGMGFTLSAYLYTIGAVQPVLVIGLFAIQSLVPNAVNLEEVRTLTFGGSGSGGVGALIATGNTLSLKAVAFYRVFGGMLILIYFAIGVSVGHRLKWYRAGLAIVSSVVFFVIATTIFWLIANVTQMKVLTRFLNGT